MSVTKVMRSCLGLDVGVWVTLRVHMWLILVSDSIPDGAIAIRHSGNVWTEETGFELNLKNILSQYCNLKKIVVLIRYRGSVFYFVDRDE